MKRWLLVPHNIYEITDVKLPMEFIIKTDCLKKYLSKHHMFNKSLVDSIFKIIHAHNNNQRLPKCEIICQDED